MAVPAGVPRGNVMNSGAEESGQWKTIGTSLVPAPYLASEVAGTPWMGMGGVVACLAGLDGAGNRPSGFIHRDGDGEPGGWTVKAVGGR